jgi:hypothetical protein
MSLTIRRITNQPSLAQFGRSTNFVIGATVLFASLGLGEAVYRIIFFDFEGARDRFPIEFFFGLALGVAAAGCAENFYRRHKQNNHKLDLVRHRNSRIRHALEAISPLAHPCRNQQSIRVIREEVDFIDRTLNEVLPAQTA